jgi:2Fe-2S ferredoxin
MPILTFEDLGISVPVDEPKSVLEAALEELVDIRHNCGGLGMCTTCRVRIIEGGERLDPPNEAELHRLGAHRLAQGWRLACQAIMREDLTIRLPRYA